MMKSSEMVEDALLVVRFQDGEEAALRELYGRYNKRFLSFASRYLGDPEAAADVVQEVWMTILRRIQKLNDPALFRAWAYRMVTNKCIDHGRKSGRERKLAEALDNRVTVTAAVEPGVVADRLETSLSLRQLMNQMPRERRSLLVLFYMDGLSVAELAGVFGLSQGTIKSRLHHARVALKVAWEQQEKKGETS